MNEEIMTQAQEYLTLNGHQILKINNIENSIST